jgi:hypothetical protein
MKKLTICLLILPVISLMGQEKITQNEEFDPFTLNEPPISFMHEAKIYEIISDSRDYSKSDYFLESYREIEQDGWKIQLYSTKNYYEADSLEKLAKQYFPDENVEKIFNAPYYKIRMGNCSRREEAEQLRQAAVRRQFNNAWIIPTRIKVKEKISINK